MLRSLKDLEGYTVSATDGDIGRTTTIAQRSDRHTTPRATVATGADVGELA
jgi:hypothetical protein